MVGEPRILVLFQEQSLSLSLFIFYWIVNKDIKDSLAFSLTIPMQDSTDF